MDHQRDDTTNRFDLFKAALGGNLTNKTLLDWGGNRGNIVYFSNGEIAESNYTSVDVDNDSLVSGKLEFPDANFIHYNRYNWCYNHAGSTTEPYPTLESSYNYVICYSVYTHTDYQDMRDAVVYLKENVNYDTMLIHFYSLLEHEPQEWFMEKRASKFGSCVDFVTEARKSDTNTVTLFDHDHMEVNNLNFDKRDSNNCLTFHRPAWLLSQFSDLGATLLTVGRTSSGNANDAQNINDIDPTISALDISNVDFKDAGFGLPRRYFLKFTS